MTDSVDAEDNGLENDRDRYMDAGTDCPVAAEVEVEVGGELTPEERKSIIDHAAQMALVGLIGGLVAVLAGVILLLVGVTGDTTWKIEGLGGSSDLQTSAAGIVIAVIGVLIIYITRFDVKVKKVVEPKAAA